MWNTHGFPRKVIHQMVDFPPRLSPGGPEEKSSTVGRHRKNDWQQDALGLSNPR
jgi:hypothetical protein